jgi:hypothetical protein
MRTKLVLITVFIVGACGDKKDDDKTAKAGTSGAPATTAAPAKTAPPPAPPPPPAPKAGFTATKRDGTKVGPMTFDHQVVTDDGNGNHMVLLIANCPQITESCSIPKYLRENKDLLNEKCPGYTEVAIAFGPKEKTANMGPLTIPVGKYGDAADAPLRASMVELSDKATAWSGMQLSPEQPYVDVTRSDAKGMAGTFAAKEDPKSIEGSFDAKACACDQNTGVCT